MLAATLHFFEVCATVIGVIADLITVWTAAVAIRERRPVPATVVETSVRFVAAFMALLYAASNSLTGFGICFGVHAATNLVLMLALLRASRTQLQIVQASVRDSPSAADEALLQILRHDWVTAQKASVSAMAATVVYSFITAFGVSLLSSSIISWVVILGATAVLPPVVVRALWPINTMHRESIVESVFVNFGRLVCGVLWMIYGVIGSDGTILGSQLALVVGYAILASCESLSLKLPPLAVVVSKKDSVWGPEPEYISGLEDEASAFNNLFYGWVEPFAKAAASEQLTLDQLPQPLKELRSWTASQQVSSQFRDEIRRFKSWDQLATSGAQVQASWDPSSRGRMRWVGTLSRAPDPEKVMVGVEWETKPKFKSPSTAFENQFHNGTFEDEFLFAQEMDGDEAFHSSCIIAEDTVVIAGGDGNIVDLSSRPVPVFPSAVRAVFTATWETIWIQAPFRVIADLCMLSSPLVLEGIVKFLGSNNPSWWYGGGLVLGMFLVTFIQSSLLHRYYHLSIRAGITQRNALLGVLFEKCLKIAPKALAHPSMNVGRVVNMVCSDAERFNDFQQLLLYFWSYPFLIVCGLALLYRLVGWCAIGGIVALSVAIPLQRRVAELQLSYRKELVARTDQRVKLTNELLSGIRIVKFMGWESNFLQRIETRRAEELHFLKRTQYCRILSALVTAATPTILVATVFVLYNISGHSLTPAVVFPTISVLNLLRIPFIQIPTLFTTYIQFNVAAGRVTKFLASDERNDFEGNNGTAVYTSETMEDIKSTVQREQCAAYLDHVTLGAFLPVKLPAIERAIDDQSFIAAARRLLSRADCSSSIITPPPPKIFSTEGKDTYTMSAKPLLSGVTMAIPKGKLTVVIGPTGSGKSTLLESTLGQLEILHGRLEVEASIAYVPQQAWIMNATVKNNILFFSEFDEQRFDDALSCCQLGVDIAALPGGIQTEIGEKGVNLSGGQRARVSMARAVYANKDVYLLDDPLSALDAHVGAALMEQCILRRLAGKTRILATHHTHVVSMADYVVELGAGGEILFQGESSEYLGTHATSTPTEPEEGHKETTATVQPSNTSQNPTSLMTKEEKASGTVPLQTYVDYFMTCGGLASVVIVLIAFFVTELIIVSNAVWLSLWSVQHFDLSQSTYLAIYVTIISVGIGSAPLRYRVAYDAMRRASRTLHSGLIRSVLRGTMSFFDTTPQGRILNRFVQDIDQADNALQLSVVSLLQMAFSAASTTVVMLVSQPITILVLIPCCFVYMRLLVFYNAANREARRIDNVVKSPVVSLLTESLSGAKTIRAFSKAHSVMVEALKRIDTTYSASYLQNVLNRWLGVRIEFLGNSIITTVAIGTVGGKLFGIGVSNVAVLSLGITMSMTITMMLNWMLRQLSAVESDMNSIQRIFHYTHHIDQEPLDIETTNLPAIQVSPSADAIVFTDVCMRYRPGLPLVLDHLTFAVPPGKRVGIVGRTGSGKSSLLLTFLRMIDISSGSIEVLNRPISQYSLNELRSLFAMVPQDPILFDGTIRTNIDPFAEHTPDALCEALSLVGMLEKVRSESKGLEGVVLDGGSNLSVGQRQLLCMARAILKRECKFVLMDEATANIDPALDRLIQQAVKTAFEGKTVITIAHRLHTIAAYDMVIVLDGGRAVEIGHPMKLFEIPNGLFRGMVESQTDSARSEIITILTANSTC